MDLVDGYLVALPREEAKTFFGFRDDAERLDFLCKLLESSKSDRLSFEGKWQRLHDVLCSLPIERSIFDQCIVGGRPLHQGPDHHVCMVRPDVVAIIADQGRDVDVSHHFDPDLQQLAKQLFELYVTAKSEQAAMVFVARIASS